MQSTPQDSWYVARGDQTYGPYTWAQMVENARGGRIGKRDKILDPRTGVWTKAPKLSSLFGPGGAAGVSLGLSAATKLAVGIVLGLALVFATVMSPYMWGEDIDLEYLTDLLGDAVSATQSDATVTSASTTLPPEGIAFKGTFQWDSAEGGGAKDISHTDPCYLWIYTTDDGTAASFDFGTVDGWPVFLVTKAGSEYVFESSDRSLVERVRIVADVTDTSVSGKVTKINKVGSFLSGTFTGTSITYEQYKAEVD